MRLNYLKATEIEIGFLLNFGRKPDFKRYIFENSKKKIRVNPQRPAVLKQRSK